MNLSKEALSHAQAFIEKDARLLEKARFLYHFNSASASDVITEMKNYQNADGGFGNALESDLRAPESSAIATSIAFQILREVGWTDCDDMVSAGIGYLLNTYDDVKINWRKIPASVESSPHAPWWSQKGREELFDAFSLNPTAELLGYLLDYGKNMAPQDQLLKIQDKILSYLGELKEIEMHDFLCCKRLASTENLDTEAKSQLLAHLQRLLKSAVTTESARWTEYGLRPIQVADYPNSPFYPVLREAVTVNLDHDIETFQQEGFWALTFSWGDVHPEIWEKVKLEWTGVFTMEKLITLKNYKRIEGYT